MFYPRSIAIVGSSPDKGKLGYNITENLIPVFLLLEEAAWAARTIAIR